MNDFFDTPMGDKLHGECFSPNTRLGQKAHLGHPPTAKVLAFDPKPLARLILLPRTSIIRAL